MIQWRTNNNQLCVPSHGVPPELLVASPHHTGSTPYRKWCHPCVQRMVPSNTSDSVLFFIFLDQFPDAAFGYRIMYIGWYRSVPCWQTATRSWDSTLQEMDVVISTADHQAVMDGGCLKTRVFYLKNVALKDPKTYSRTRSLESFVRISCSPQRVLKKTYYID